MLSVIGILALSFAAISCDDDDENKIDEEEPAAGAAPTLEVVTAGSNYGEVALTTSGIADYAYLCYEQAEDPSEAPEASVLYRTGTTGTCVDGTNTVTISGLANTTTYHAYFALRTTEGSYYEDILDVTFTTTDYDEGITLAEVYYDGFKAHIKVPQEVKDRGNVLRYFYSEMFYYNENKFGYGMSDAQSLLYNGGVYASDEVTIDDNDDTINYDEDNETWAHDPMVPGEPIYLCVGEFAWGSGFGLEGEGYYSWLFDEDAWSENNDSWELLSTKVTEYDESAYWTGYYDRILFTTKEPSVLDADLNISSEMSATRGELTIAPDDNVVTLSVMLLDDATYQTILDTYLPEEYMQWFTTSYVANYYGYANTFDGAGGVLTIEDYVTLQPEVLYHAFVVGLGDESGTSQCYEHYEFETTPKEMTEPVVEVTAIANPSGTESPYEAWFNVKAPNSDVEYAYYAANYEREWASSFRSYTGTQVVNNNASYCYFSSSELSAINSADGYDIMFASRPNSTTYLAVLGYNEEDTCNTLNFNSIDDADSEPAVDKFTTVKETYNQIESDLFTSLLGEWTASYSLKSDSNYSAGTYTNTVTIVSGVDYPETLADSVYTIYADYGFDKDEVNALYEEFKEECDIFNESVRGNNRLLCLGFGQNMEYQSPYDLFVSQTYSSYDNAAILYDFGPKWYIEIASDGSISVPFNSSRLYPLSSWDVYSGSYITYYLMGRDITSSSTVSGYVTYGDDYETLYFPATLADDVITISPLTYDGSDYYMNAGRLYSGYITYPNGTINSDVVMTKGASAETASVSSIPVENLHFEASSVKCSVGAKPRSPKITKPAKELKNLGSVRVIDLEAFREFEENQKSRR